MRFIEILNCKIESAALPALIQPESFLCVARQFFYNTKVRFRSLHNSLSYAAFEKSKRFFRFAWDQFRYNSHLRKIAMNPLAFLLLF